MRPITTCLLAIVALAPLAACGSKTEDRLKALDERIAKLETQQRAHEAVTLKPGGEGYGLIQTDLGRIAIAIADVQPYANGSRVILDFGNPTSARLSGAKARIEWGATDSKGLPVVGGTTQSREFTAPEPLPPGSWRRFPVDLAGTPPTRLGWIRVSGFDSGTVDLLSQ